MLRSISRHHRRVSIASTGKAALLAALLLPAFLLARAAHTAPHAQLSSPSISAPYALIRPSDLCNGATLPC